jgi:signal transduction histidine kinase
VTRSIAKGISIYGFPNELAQVVLNIVNNAKEAILSSGRRDGRITIRAEQVDGHAGLTVQNNGGCIPDDVLPRIFDAYFTTKEKGSGIGLYMSKLIVETHLQGRIEARNIPDGAEFVITCPLAQTAS